MGEYINKKLFVMVDFVDIIVSLKVRTSNKLIYFQME
jgi:hypothetical protein